MSPLFYINIIQIVIAAALIVLVLLQTKSTSLGSVFGGDSSIHKTRRASTRLCTRQPSASASCSSSLRWRVWCDGLIVARVCRRLVAPFICRPERRSLLL